MKESIRIATPNDLDAIVTVRFNRGCYDYYSQWAHKYSLKRWQEGQHPEENSTCYQIIRMAPWDPTALEQYLQLHQNLGNLPMIAAIEKLPRPGPQYIMQLSALHVIQDLDEGIYK